MTSAVDYVGGSLLYVKRLAILVFVIPSEPVIIVYWL